MKEGKEEHDWNLFSNVSYTVACLLSTNSKKLKREDFNLYALTKKAQQQREATPEQLEQIASMFQ